MIENILECVIGIQLVKKICYGNGILNVSAVTFWP
jgi:hypothetical protein